jgi:H+/Cl- antiporter ClcA
MGNRFRRLAQLARGEESLSQPPRLADESRWYTEHTALLISTLKWAGLGVASGLCVGLATGAFLWSLAAVTRQVHVVLGTAVPAWAFLPVALPLGVWLVRRFAPEARGHGTEAVIAAVHQRSGRMDWLIAPVKLGATVLTLSFGGSVGKEGPAAQIGAALTSAFADLFRLSDDDRRRLVICGISAGFAAVFGTPISGALFGIEVLFLGRLDYSVIFPALVAGIVAHLACGVQAPFPVVQGSLGGLNQVQLLVVSLSTGAAFGMVALLLIESMRALERVCRRLEPRPFLLAALGGAGLAGFFALVGDRYAGLGTETIAGVMAGTTTVALAAFLYKIVATAVTLETGGSGGILTPVFFVGVTSGAAIAQLVGLPQGMLAAFGFVAVLAAAANTPIAAAVMAIELLPAPVAVFAALSAATAFLLVGHRSVYASQKLGLSKSAGLDIDLGMPIGELNRAAVRIRKGSLADRVQRFGRSLPRAFGEDDDPEGR